MLGGPGRSEAIVLLITSSVIMAFYAPLFAHGAALEGNRAIEGLRRGYQAQGSSMNVTIRAYTCDGSSLVEEGSFRPTIRLSFENGTGFGTCNGPECVFTDVAAGNYTVQVYYRNVKVYEGSLLADLNNTTIDLKVNTTWITVRVHDDEGRELDSYKMVLERASGGLTVEFSKGSSRHLLPFGKYKVSRLEYTLAGGIKFSQKLEGEVVVSCGNRSIEEPAPVAHRAIVVFERITGEPLKGSNIRYAISLGVGDEWREIKSGILSKSNSVILYQVPYGTYRVSVYMKDKEIHRGFITISQSSKNIKIGVNLLSRVRLRLRDIDGYPMLNTTAYVETPLGTDLYTSDTNGIIELFNVPAGIYRVYFDWRGTVRVLSEVNVTTNALYEVTVGLKSFEVVLEASNSLTLPKGLEATFFLGRDGIVLARASVDEELPRLSLKLSRLPIDGEYYLRVAWKNKLLIDQYRITVDKDTDRLSLTLPLYDLKISFVDAKGSALPEVKVSIIWEGGHTEWMADDSGVLVIRHLLRENYDLQVFWRGVVVSRYLLGIKDLEKGSITVTCSVYDVKVRVYGWFNRPLIGANVSLLLDLLNYTKFMNSQLIPTSGEVYFTRIPLPVHYRLLLVVGYGGKRIEELLLPEEASKGVISKEIFVDAVLAIAGYGFSMLEFVALVAAILVAASVVFLAYRWYNFKRELRTILIESEVLRDYRDRTVEIVERRYRGMRGFIRRLREYIEEVLKGGREEEEGWDIFE